MPETASIPAATAEPVAPGRQRPEPLWIAVDFPALALEVHGLGVEPTVTVVDRRHGPRVHRACPRAKVAGVRQGMNLSAALALCPELCVHARDEAAEQQHLQRRALGLDRFTPSLSLDPPTTVLLEVHASLRLFGGVDGLRQALHESLRDQGCGFRLAAAPTPGAASLLARAGCERFLTRHATLRSALADLPIESLSLATATSLALRRIGVDTLRDVWRLPRDGLGRRFGRDLPRLLDQVLGRHPDPRPGLVGAQRFHIQRDLPFETCDHESLLTVIELLIQSLGRFLRERDLAASRLHLSFEHLRNPVSRCVVGTRLPTRDLGRLYDLCRDRLRDLRLPAPVVRVRLTVEEFQPFLGRTAPLFERPQTGDRWLRSCEQIEARLGPDSLAKLWQRDDHRPERAWRQGVAIPADTPGPPAGRARPLWLLPQPRPMNTEWRELSILSGPERIETGWWDGEDCCRDYYQVRQRSGSRLWIFHDLKCGGWYLHGLFG